MSLATGLGVGAAALSALATNLSFLYKHRGAVAAPDVDVRRPVRSAVDLFRSKWWTVGWLVAAAGFAAHVAALALLPLSVAQAVLSGGFVLLAVLAERFFGFELRRRQWLGIGLVAVSMALLAVTGQGASGDHADYSLTTMILFEAAAVAIGLLFIFSHRIERVRAQHGVLLGAAAGLGFGVADVAVKALSGHIDGVLGLLSPWTLVIVAAGIASFFASARSLQIGEGVSVIAVTSVAANMSAIVAGVLVFGDPLGEDALLVVARVTAFTLVIVAAALIPAPVRAGERLRRSAEPRAAPAGAL